MNDVDAIVIGSGQGGVPFAVDLARAGKQVVIFERGRLGGSCVNYGCTPSKAFLAAAHAAGRARDAATLGIHAEVRVDFPAVMERVRSIRDEWTAGVEDKVRDAQIVLVRAEAHFSGERTVTGGTATYRAPLVVINTGTSAAVPKVEGLGDVPYLTNESFFEQRALPGTMLVMGGGYIGLELGQGMARLGSRVHIVDPGPHVLGREEADAAEMLQRGLERDGVALHLGRRVTSARKDDGGCVLTLDDGSELRGDALLVATGRVPNTKMLEAPANGIELDERGNVRIDDQFRTTCDGVYSIGDAAGQPAFTHVSWEDYRRLTDIVAGGARTRDDRVLAYSTFTEPQVARVGMTIDQAREAGHDAREKIYRNEDMARAVEWGHDLGFYRLVVEVKTDRILGATLVGYEAGEIVHVILAHIEAKATWHDLDRCVHIHPTYCEVLPSLARLFAG